MSGDKRQAQLNKAKEMKAKRAERALMDKQIAEGSEAVAQESRTEGEGAHQSTTTRLASSSLATGPVKTEDAPREQTSEKAGSLLAAKVRNLEERLSQAVEKKKIQTKFGPLEYLPGQEFQYPNEQLSLYITENCPNRSEEYWKSVSSDVEGDYSVLREDIARTKGNTAPIEVVLKKEGDGEVYTLYIVAGETRHRILKELKIKHAKIKILEEEFSEKALRQQRNSENIDTEKTIWDQSRLIRAIIDEDYAGNVELYAKSSNIDAYMTNGRASSKVRTLYNIGRYPKELFETMLPGLQHSKEYVFRLAVKKIEENEEFFLGVIRDEIATGNYNKRKQKDCEKIFKLACAKLAGKPEVSKPESTNLWASEKCHSNDKQMEFVLKGNGSAVLTIPPENDDFIDFLNEKLKNLEEEFLKI